MFRSIGGPGIRVSRHKRDLSRRSLLSGSGKAVCALALTGLLLATGPGCAADLPPSLGNIESPRDPGEPPGPLQEAEIGETSEWKVLREASRPEWARDHQPALPADASDETPTPKDPGSPERHTPEERRETAEGTPDDALVVVDREHGLPEDYAPDDLVYLPPLGIPTLRGERMRLRDEAAEATARMVADARAAGFEIVICSAYRSHEAQVVSYGRLTALHGEGAGGFSAPPGHSEHQLGTVVDISNASSDFRLDQSFGETRAAEWLRQNAAEYGFVLSYPREAESHTGYRWEPWHYRYIGPENARSYREGDYDSPQRFFREEGVIPES